MDARWTVLGQGAIGLLAASRLHLAGKSVQLLRRDTGTFTYHFEQNGLRQRLALESATAPFEFVLVPTKAYAIPSAIESLLPQLSEHAQLVLSHNGLGSIEQVLPRLQKHQGLWFVSTSQASFKQSQTEVLHTGQGPSYLACLKTSEHTPALALCEVRKAMAIAFSPLTEVDNITPLLWRKLAVNAVINPLTALYDLPNGALQDTRYHPQMKALIAEFTKIAALCGQVFSQEELFEVVLTVAKNTAQNYSSMHQDKQHGRALELEAITGYLLRQAKKAGITLPSHQALYEALT